MLLCCVVVGAGSGGTGGGGTTGVHWVAVLFLHLLFDNEPLRAFEFSGLTISWRTCRTMMRR